MSKKILITGATGFIGKKLAKSLQEKGFELLIHTRNRANAQKIFGEKVNITSDFESIKNNAKIDAIINLAGENIGNKKWTDSQKRELKNSRINTTVGLVKLIERLNEKPKTFISASAIGYYGSRGDEVLNENSAPKNEFTNQLCTEWEKAANRAKKYDVRTCITRFGVVLGKDGGALAKMLPPFKLGLGGKIGSGAQYFSWVHIDDVVSAINFLLKKDTLSGEFNVTAPNPVTNIELTKSLGTILKRPTLLPLPAFVIKTIFGEMGETLLLKGQRVIPENLKEAGYKFKYKNIDDALNEILS
jgi:uncharacterized protein (TIGR01777 family)